MNIYRISRPDEIDYDTYDCAVVIAETEEEAKTIHPNGYDVCTDAYDFTWIYKKDVIVELIGKANKDQKKGVVVGSFNAG